MAIGTATPSSTALTPAAARRLRRMRPRRAVGARYPVHRALKTRAVPAATTNVLADWNGPHIAPSPSGARLARPTWIRRLRPLLPFIAQAIRDGRAAAAHLSASAAPSIAPCSRTIAAIPRPPCVSRRSTGAAIYRPGRAAGSRWSVRSIGTEGWAAISVLSAADASDLILRPARA